MLVLSRKIGEKIVIDGDIVLEVLEITRTGKVRLGIRAPEEIPVLRAELMKPDQGKKPEGK